MSGGSIRGLPASGKGSWVLSHCRVDGQAVAGDAGKVIHGGGLFRQYGEIVRKSWDAGAVVVILACCLRRMRQWSRLAFRRDWKMVTGW